MPPSTATPRIALGPDEMTGWLRDAIVAGGGHVVAASEADALIWNSSRDVEGLARLLEEHPGLAWVQLPFAGIENFIRLIDDTRTWTCGKGVYAEPVAEMALALALAGMRNVGPYARAVSWSRQAGVNLFGADVTILGGGGITESLLRLLAPFDCHITVVRNHVQDMPGAALVVDADGYSDAIANSDLVVLALALTPDTEGIIGASELELMGPNAWLVNVARGRHVVTEDLVDALQRGVIAGAALDVTDPEPLPDGHPLWSLPNCIITPHTGNTPAMAQPLLAARVESNVRRWAEGEELIGNVDPALGY
jgi:phosphoglycerate dehydrogenase-like enzyme